MKMTNEQIVQALQYLIGSRYVPTVKAYVSELTGRGLVIGKGDRSGKDHNPERVCIVTDDADLITDFVFG